MELTLRIIQTREMLLTLIAKRDVFQIRGKTNLSNVSTKINFNRFLAIVPYLVVNNNFSFFINNLLSMWEV